MVFRYHLGEGITKKESDLAAEVEQQQQALKGKAAEKKAQGPQEAAPQPEEQQIPSVKVSCCVHQLLFRVGIIVHAYSFIRILSPFAFMSIPTSCCQQLQGPLACHAAACTMPD